MPHGNSYGELVLCGIFVIVFLMYFGLLFRKRWYILVPKKGKKMEDIENEGMREKKLSLSYAERDNFQNDG